MKNLDITMYYVTDTNLLNEKYDLYHSVQDAIKGGATIIQLREKDMSTRDFYKEAVELKQLCDKYDVPLIINDRIDIALAVDSDGVHLGQDDMPIEIARKILGEDKIIGISASNLKDALEAEKDGADYLGVGAMYSTNTKTDADLTSLEELKKIKETVNIPICAIGGINEKTIPDLKEAQIDGLAIVSAISMKEDAKKATRELKNIFLRQYKTKAVLFDIDGTMIESISIWDRVFEKLLQKYKMQVSDIDRQKVWKMDFEESARYFIKKYCLDESVKGYLKNLEEISVQEYQNSDIKLKKGIIEFLHYLKENDIKIAVCTSLTKRQSDVVLKKTGIEKEFEYVFSSEELGYKKSDRKFYEYISEKLNIPSCNIVLFEDDITSAKAVKQNKIKFCLSKNESIKKNDIEMSYVDYEIEDFAQREILKEIIVL